LIFDLDPLLTNGTRVPADSNDLSSGKLEEKQE